MEERGHEGTGAQGHGDGMRVLVVSPERVLFDGHASAVVVPAYDGLVGILPRHAPFVALLGRGVTRVTADGAQARFSVAGGVVQVLRDVVRIVTYGSEVMGDE